MKIALTVEGTRGDVYPMLALGEHLAADGHLVRIVAPPDFRSEEEHSLCTRCRAVLERNPHLSSACS